MTFCLFSWRHQAVVSFPADDPWEGAEDIQWAGKTSSYGHTEVGGEQVGLPQETYCAPSHGVSARTSAGCR